MENNLKKILLEEVVMAVIERNKNKITETQIRKLVSTMVEIAMPMIHKNNEELVSLHSHQVLHGENTRKLFREIISLIENITKRLLDEYVEKSMIKYEYDNKAKKNVMIARTKVLESTVDFLNALNDLVIRYYQEVYYIWGDKQESTNKTDRQEPFQTSLF